MAQTPAIEDDEFVLRHIPGGSEWQAPGPRITSYNFRLRREQGETGVSVTRLRITAPEKRLTLVKATPESRVAAAQVANVRALGLRVVPKPVDEDPGHAEIQSDIADLDNHSVRKRLAKIFRFVAVTLSS